MRSSVALHPYILVYSSIHLQSFELRLVFQDFLTLKGTAMTVDGSMTVINLSDNVNILVNELKLDKRMYYQLFKMERVCKELSKLFPF